MIPSKVIYFASPYSSSDIDVVNKRFESACKVVANLVSEGYVVFSPIIYGHTLVEWHKMPSDWEFWRKFCQSFLVKCDEMVVYKLEGWEDSKGVQAEIELANQLGLNITYIEPR
jgi:Domain of unknown function (DUF1937)